MVARCALTCGLCVAALFLTGTACAQDEPGEGGEESSQTIIDELADSIADSLSPRWAGPRRPWPERRDRPTTAGVVRSVESPIALHVGEGVLPEDADEALEALEYAHRWLESNDWPTPLPDGGAGGTGETDVYLAYGLAGEGERLAFSSYDAAVPWLGTDAATTFAGIDAGVDAGRLTACVVSAYVQASLLSSDPAEANGWRVATGDYLAWLLTGQFGCSDAGLVAHQRAGGRTWVGSASDSGEGGALFLALLSARTDGLSGRFIRDIWSGAPQRTWDGDELRASPDLWEVLNVVMDIGDDPLQRLIEEMGVARYFIGDAGRRAGAPIPLLRTLPSEASVRVLGRTRYEELPRRFEPRGLELEAYGSAYVEVDVSEAEPGSQLRIWLRGEIGVAWSLTAVRLAEDGSERGRVRAPVRLLTPRAYVPLEITDEETHSVLIVVTNLGSRLVDADTSDEQVRSFRLILDREDDADDAGVPD
ncbi:MAG: hypothetical protein AB8I08_14880 [Sandaracinaceae bacterium]